MTLVEDNWFVRELELEIHRCYSPAAEALCERLFKRRFAQGLATYLLQTEAERMQFLDANRPQSDSRETISGACFG